MTESFSERIICRRVPPLDSDGSATETPSRTERGSFLWDVQNSRNAKLQKNIDVCIGGKDTVSLILKSLQALVMIPNCMKQDSYVLRH